jgi:hypothetical protein
MLKNALVPHEASEQAQSADPRASFGGKNALGFDGIFTGNPISSCRPARIALLRPHGAQWSPESDAVCDPRSNFSRRKLVNLEEGGQRDDEQRGRIFELPAFSFCSALYS